MLTSHHYLLGSLFAVLCAVGTAPRNIHAHGISAGISKDIAEDTSEEIVNMGNRTGLSQSFAELETPSETSPAMMDIAYRGSGRLSGEPVKEERRKDTYQMAHRGSGRVAPLPI